VFKPVATPTSVIQLLVYLALEHIEQVKPVAMISAFDI
jgi:hypothetical protein